MTIESPEITTMCFCPDCGAATRMGRHLDMDCRTIMTLSSELARLREEISTQETLVATLQEQKYAWDELQSENARLRKEIEDAPHDCTCDIEFETTEHNGCACGMDTWKRNALKGGK